MYLLVFSTLAPMCPFTCYHAKICENQFQVLDAIDQRQFMCIKNEFYMGKVTNIEQTETGTLKVCFKIFLPNDHEILTTIC